MRRGCKPFVEFIRRVMHSVVQSLVLCTLGGGTSTSSGGRISLESEIGRVLTV